MAGGNAIRGSRVGAGPMGEAERGEAAPRVFVSFWCSNGHETRPSFAEEPGLAVPEPWDCPRCGFPAGQDQENPPAPPKVEPYKTHLAYVKERRSDADGQAILDEALRAACAGAASSAESVARAVPRRTDAAGAAPDQPGGTRRGSRSTSRRCRRPRQDHGSRWHGGLGASGRGCPRRLSPGRGGVGVEEPQRALLAVDVGAGVSSTATADAAAHGVRLVGAGDEEPHLARRGAGTRRSARPGSGGGLGEPCTATARGPLGSAGWCGKSEATWPSGPTPSRTTSKSGRSPARGRGSSSAYRCGGCLGRPGSVSGPATPWTWAGSSPSVEQGRRRVLGLVAVRVAGRQVALVAPPHVDAGPVDRVPRGPAASDARIAEPIEPPVSDDVGRARGPPARRRGRRRAGRPRPRPGTARRGGRRRCAGQSGAP